MIAHFAHTASQSGTFLHLRVPSPRGNLELAWCQQRLEHHLPARLLLKCRQCEQHEMSATTISCLPPPVPSWYWRKGLPLLCQLRWAESTARFNSLGLVLAACESGPPVFFQAAFLTLTRSLAVA